MTRPTVRSAATILFCVLAAGASAHPAPEHRIDALALEIAAHPDRIDLHLLRGELLREAGRFDDALQEIEQSLALDPSSKEAMLCLAALHLDAGRHPSALDALQTAGVSSAEARLLRSRANEGLGRLDQALEDLNAFLAMSPRLDPDFYLRRARLVLRNDPKACDRALRGLDQGIELLGPVISLVQEAVSIELHFGRLEDAQRRLSLYASPPETPSPPERDRKDIELAGWGETSGVLVPRGADWHYEATGTDLGTAWRDTTTTDTTWSEGPAPLGYGDPFIVTTVPFGPNPNAKYTTTYFRHTFVSDDPSGVQSLTLEANYDDGFAAYLNGVEIARRSLAAGATYGTFATSHEGGVYEAIDVSAGASLLQTGTNLLAVEVHQTTANSSDLAWAGALVASEVSTQITRGPYLQLATPGGITVRWRTSTATAGRVRFGTTLGVWDEFADHLGITTEHEVRIEGLDPATAYYYAVGTPAEILASGPAFRFRTHPDPGENAPVRIWAIGDSGTKDANAAAVRDGYHAFSAGAFTDVWLMLGDNAYNLGTDAEYQAAVFDMYPEFLQGCALWPTRGNHDLLYAGANNDYYDLFTLPTQAEAGGVLSGTEAYYAFDYAGVHFICLDSEGSNLSSGGAMMTWLATDLDSTDADWIIAFWHHPPYTKGSHDSDNPTDSGGRMRDMRQNALPILEAGGVDLVLCGHSHSYERSFLLDEHYGVSGTLADSMKIDAGDGDPTGDGAYEKPGGGPVPHEGAVYAVAGSSGQVSGGTLNHPVMVASLNVLGSVVIDIDENQLDAQFIGVSGNVLDAFAVVKSQPTAVPGEPEAGALRLASAPNPFSYSTRIEFQVPAGGRVRLRVVDASGRHVATLVDDTLPPGDHVAWWDGRDGSGPAASGMYFSLLESAGETASRKILLQR